VGTKLRLIGSLGKAVLAGCLPIFPLWCETYRDRMSHWEQ